MEHQTQIASSGSNPKKYLDTKIITNLKIIELANWHGQTGTDRTDRNTYHQLYRRIGQSGGTIHANRPIRRIREFGLTGQHTDILFNNADSQINIDQE